MNISPLMNRLKAWWLTIKSRQLTVDPHQFNPFLWRNWGEFLHEVWRLQWFFFKIFLTFMVWLSSIHSFNVFSVFINFSDLSILMQCRALLAAFLLFLLLPIYVVWLYRGYPLQNIVKFIRQQWFGQAVRFAHHTPLPNLYLFITTGLIGVMALLWWDWPILASPVTITALFIMGWWVGLPRISQIKSNNNPQTGGFHGS